MSVNASERGDTLIEVFVAITVLSIVTVSVFSIMNKGVASMYDSLERAQVRQILDAQSEMLQYARDQYVVQQTPQSAAMSLDDAAAAAVWIRLRDTTQVPDIAGIPGLNDCHISNAFYLTMKPNGGNTTMVLEKNGVISPSSGLPEPGNGLWIQKISSQAAQPVPYKDFYIKACWQPVGSDVPQVLSSVVRLYDQN